MKIITKILNVFLIVLVLSGIVFPILYFNVVKQNKIAYEEVLSKNTQLTEQIENVELIKESLKDSLIIKDVEIFQHKEQISELMMENSNLHMKLNTKLQELSDMSLEQILNYLRDYYHTNGTEIKITRQNDTIMVSIAPQLAREWANDITKLESLDIELSGYKNQISEYELMMCSYESKIELLDSTNVLNEEIIKGERDKNSNFEKLLENRNKKIKSLKIQRNAAGVIVAIVIVLAII